MSEMKPIKRKGSLLERADARFDFGGQLRRLEPGALGDGPVLEDKTARRTPTPKTARKAVVRDSALTDAPTTAVATPPSAAVAPSPSRVALARRRFVPRAAMQHVDRALMAAHGLVDSDSATGALAEEYRLVKRQLLRNAGNSPLGRRILVTSAQPDEGKTYSSINLALSLAAEHEVSVLLIDGDFARQQVPDKLGIVPGKGLLDALADPSVNLADCVIPTDIPELSVLPAGTSTTRDTEYMSSARMQEVLATLDADAPDRIILFDSMPLLAASSAGVIAQYCGQVVVVVRADVTREAALRDAIGLIGQHNGISLLLNRVRFTPEGRRFGSYYGEGG
ncbi:MAG: capsular biosynthesis protein [Pseudomonadota bacterium]